MAPGTWKRIAVVWGPPLAAGLAGILVAGQGVFGDAGLWVRLTATGLWGFAAAWFFGAAIYLRRSLLPLEGAADVAGEEE